MSVIIINGANKTTSRVTAVQQYIEEYLTAAQIEHDSIVVHSLPAEDLITANFASNAIQNANAKVEKASDVIVLTPIYKASYSGILKTFLDLIPQKGLEDKFVRPIMVGGSINHLLAIEYALKPVLSVLGATHISNGVFIMDKHIERLEEGKFNIEVSVLERLQAQLNNIKLHEATIA